MSRPENAKISWQEAEISLKPNPGGRQFWRKPYFGFAKDVVSRYMLDDLFAEHFPEYGSMEFGRAIPSDGSRYSNEPTVGYVYVIRSEYGFKIGKTVNIKQRTRLFEVKLPFPITVEHYARFEDYSEAERFFHQRFYSQRLEGEWFDLSDDDLAYIKDQGESVSVEGL